VRILSYILLLFIILLGVTFAMLNSEPVAINYYLGHRTMPLSLLLVSVFSAGCLLGILVAGWLIIKIKMQNHSLRKRLKLAEKEVENLRAIPLKDQH
jgi:lipopolysaccharide assembly protein A